MTDTPVWGCRSLFINNTANYKQLPTPQPKSPLFLFLHLEAQRLDGADNLFGGGGACHGDEAAGEVCVYVLGAGQGADGADDVVAAVIAPHTDDGECLHLRCSIGIAA